MQTNCSEVKGHYLYDTGRSKVLYVSYNNTTIFTSLSCDVSIEMIDVVISENGEYAAILANKVISFYYGVKCLFAIPHTTNSIDILFASNWIKNNTLMSKNTYYTTYIVNTYKHDGTLIDLRLINIENIVA